MRLATHARRGLLALVTATATVTLVVATPACVTLGGKRGKQAEVPMGSWPAWQDLSPLVEVAEAHVDEPTFAALERASALLREGKPRSADRALAEAAAGSGRHWIAVARADLAAFYFESCIRGVAWRLPDEPGARARTIDFDPQTRVEPEDLSVEALLTNLDDALAAGGEGSALTTQARIARVRVTSFVTTCPANEEVARRASAIMTDDLATLAAEKHLTPDLAYLWAGVQLQTYSGAAARPFLLQAIEGGFDEPSIAYMLAGIAFEQGELAEAAQLAEQAEARYQELGQPARLAQCRFLRGEIELAQKNWAAAEGHFESTLELVPDHGAAMLGLAAVELERSDAFAAGERLGQRIQSLTRSGEELDEPAALAIVDTLEELVIVANADELELAQVTRDALLLSIDKEPDPFRRGLRYFYAATLEVRLGDYDSARGHAATAAIEFEDSWVNIPDKVNPRAFLDRLDQAM